MTGDTINLYGDTKKEVRHGFGVDVASQRLDDLDTAALIILEERRKAFGRATALEVGCGPGFGMARRFIEAGAEAMTIDAVDYSAEADALQLQGLSFKVGDIKAPSDWGLKHEKFDLFFSQRTVHYVTFAEALDMLRFMRQYLLPGAGVAISASGLDSELGEGYTHRKHRLEERFAPLAPHMQEKHGIRKPVCLYTAPDLEKLVVMAGMKPVNVYQSAFGNIKLVGAR